jgi:hypothetical protein
MVNIALGNADLSQCEDGDGNGDGSITVDEILMAVNNALNGCPPAPSYGISGTIRYVGTDVPVPGVVVALEGATTLSAQTDANGRFVFDAVSAGRWSIEPVKRTGPNLSIGVDDAGQALQFSGGLATPSAEQRLVCDVTGDGTITQEDGSLILEYVVGQITRFPVADACGSDWVFVPVPSATAHQSITQPVFSGGTCQLGSISFDPLSTDAIGQDFEAVVIGDCNLSWPN